MVWAGQAEGIYWGKGKKEDGEEEASGRRLGKGSLVNSLEGQEEAERSFVAGKGRMDTGVK